MSGTIKTEIDDGICTLTLENKGKRNAISYGMMDAAIDAITELEERDDDHVLVLTGAGNNAFSAGFDLSQDRDSEKEDWWRKLNETVEKYEYPTVAMINGDTYGGAVELIASCDMRVGVRDARFGITPARIGIVYSPEAITRVIRLVGSAKAKELLFTGNAINGNSAHEMGLLNHVVDTNDLTDKTYDLASTMANNAPLSLKGMKDIIRAINEKEELSETERQWARSLRADSFNSRDHEEGVEAFAENREPNFEGR